MVTEQLEAIIRVNAPLPAGLEASARDVRRNTRLKVILLTLRDDIASGMRLAEAMRLRPRFFPKFYVDMVKVGEDTGSLDKTFSGLREIILLRIAVDDRRRAYLAYLVFLACFGIGPPLFIGTYIAPIFVEILGDFGGEPSQPLQTLMTITSYLKSPEFLLKLVAPACLAVILAIKIVKRLLRGSNIVSRGIWAFLLNAPVLNRLWAKRLLSHVALLLQALLTARIPLDEALENAAEYSMAGPYIKALHRLRDKVCDGISLRAAMEKEGIFPKSFRAACSMGESSGRLPEVLGWIGSVYRREADKLDRVLLDVIAPLGVIGVGAWVLLIAIAVFTASAQIADSLAASM